MPWQSQTDIKCPSFFLSCRHERFSCLTGKQEAAGINTGPSDVYFLKLIYKSVSPAFLPFFFSSKLNNKWIILLF